eukprot:CAMPEP_0119543758 /NCGR_PEP_ID=MMETSP1344-20130328/54321_1 /TAXON_ID=236787 /ORGANISM="Florenciella parvula, Strain CCMP2471" /LENGTH=434 /DNA_ID=CAMNT_0007588137 /DNA_START=94 /DNA_END=1398 /DNA_ORIENTATION=-
MAKLNRCPVPGHEDERVGPLWVKHRSPPFYGPSKKPANDRIRCRKCEAAREASAGAGANTGPKGGLRSFVNFDAPHEPTCGRIADSPVSAEHSPGTPAKEPVGFGNPLADPSSRKLDFDDVDKRGEAKQSFSITLGPEHDTRQKEMVDLRRQAVALAEKVETLSNENRTLTAQLAASQRETQHYKAQSQAIEAEATLLLKEKAAELQQQAKEAKAEAKAAETVLRNERRSLQELKLRNLELMQQAASVKEVQVEPQTHAEAAPAFTAGALGGAEQEVAQEVAQEIAQEVAQEVEEAVEQAVEQVVEEAVEEEVEEEVAQEAEEEAEQAVEEEVEQQVEEEVAQEVAQEIEAVAQQQEEEAAGAEKEEDEELLQPAVGGILADFNASLDKGLARYKEQKEAEELAATAAKKRAAKKAKAKRQKENKRRKSGGGLR